MTTAAAPSAGCRALHRDPAVRRWLMSYSLSLVGDGAYFLALGWAAHQLAGPSKVGIVLAVGAAPRAVLMLWGGVLADRLGPRPVVLVSDATRALLVLATAVALAWWTPGWWLLLVVAAVYGVADALFLPAVAALPALLTGPDQLARLHGLRALAIRLGETVGPPVVGAMIALGGLPAAFAAIGALLAVSLLLLATLRIDRPPTTAPDHGAPDPDGDGEAGGGSWRSLREGVAYVRRHRLLVALLASLALTELGAIPPLNLGTLLLADHHGWGPQGAGWIVGAFGAGAGTGALLLTLLGRLRREGPLYIGAQTLGAVALAGVALTPALPAAVALAAATGLGFGFAGALVFALIQAATDYRYLGRVMALVYLVSVALTPLSYPAFNALADTAGITTTWTGSALLGLLGAAIAAASTPLRRWRATDTEAGASAKR